MARVSSASVGHIPHLVPTAPALAEMAKRGRIKTTKGGYGTSVACSPHSFFFLFSFFPFPSPRSFPFLPFFLLSFRLQSPLSLLSSPPFSPLFPLSLLSLPFSPLFPLPFLSCRLQCPVSQPVASPALSQPLTTQQPNLQTSLRTFSGCICH